MVDHSKTKDVGAPDPELQTSPIAEETDEEYAVLRQELEGEPFCYFNNERFSNDAYVRSGSALLRCDYGVWLRIGSADQDND